ncbi:hypothetical protein UO65_2835 [Actinokineospora spheciospongiae]|uniref:Uncharacterized protein n=1 Tax=Actinokineospora spheciospongiae TaxID=909613 RepID=W7IYF2_9PSEU|nr:hypothetical protein UO65_2835 [Actinokineospora spheciospongiae]
MVQLGESDSDEAGGTQITRTPVDPTLPQFDLAAVVDEAEDETS